MKKIVGFFFFWIALQCSIQAQITTSIDTTAVYKRARSVAGERNPEKLAKNLSDPFKDDASKVLAMSYWITRNIKYEYSGLGARAVEIKTPEKVLKTRKALSTEYAQLFVAMCAAVNIKAEAVDGYVKDFDFFPGDTLFKAEHTWNVVRINNDWHIVDLTYAGYTFNPSVSSSSKFLYSLFRIPQSSDMKPVRKYSPQWICISPTAAVRTHLPVLAMFQLLQNPVSIEQFQQRDTAVKRHVQQYPQKLSDCSAIDYFVELPQMEKYKILASQTLQQNPYAHLNAAFYNYYVVDLFKTYHYLDENGHLFASQKDLKDVLLYARKADTLFQIAIQNDGKRLTLAQERSTAWRRDLMNYNKIHQAETQAMSKRYAKSLQNANKLNSQIPSMIAAIDKNMQKYSVEAIQKQHRPTTQRNEDLYAGMDLLEKADTYYEQSQETLQQYNDVLGNLLAANPQAALAKQKEAKAINERNTTVLRNYISNKSSNMPMGYASNKSINKEVFTENMRKIENLNAAGTDTIVNVLLTNFPAINSSLKKYSSLTGAYLNALLTAKSKLAHDGNEDARYTAAVEEYARNMNTVKEELTQIHKSLPEITTILKSEEKLFAENTELLKRDNMLETIRHKRYIEYRKKYRQIDVEYIKYFIKQNKENQKIIKKVIT
ncbi:MAG: hypothetical protein LBU90_10015 [Bacteroidales bacterium]|jgi:hypothetical protein|nr:hypothetical protein [Bacteroidales bacterium]